jgi:hypothetical protein
MRKGRKEGKAGMTDGVERGTRKGRKRQEEGMKRGRATEVGEIREESKLGRGGREAGQLD